MGWSDAAVRDGRRVVPNLKRDADAVADQGSNGAPQG
jgi:hypothetical protein